MRYMAKHEHEGHWKRLREQFLLNNGEGMLEHQLLELLLTYSRSQGNVNPLAHRLIKRFGGLQGLARADPYELMQEDGVGEKTAVLLSLVAAIGKRAQYTPPQSLRILNYTDAIPLCKSLVGSSKHEELWVITLNSASRVLHADKISSGTPTETPMYARLVTECALRHGAMGVILCHNHPTGNVKPSQEDLAATDKVISALSPLGIRVYDHIIIGGENYFSFWSAHHLEGGQAEEELSAAAQRKE